MAQSRGYRQAYDIRELRAIGETMDEFSEKERAAIDDLLKRDFENATSDEIQLYARWQAYIALRDEEFKAKIELQKSESEARIKALADVAKAAKKNLTELKKAALKRLEVIENG